MILAVKLYFEVEENLKPEETQEVIRLIQKRVEETILRSHPFLEGYKLQAKAFRFLAKLRTWNEVKKRLNIKLLEEDK